ncbi:uncharacterized protein LOC105170638 isoform X2 [Sesamum indicum]|uniref:Uncharacterized protein LOC105170638 isoform X2 n=1 Tax=Sesamum indicum TaxID=4182 RepID=A0A6I9U7D0_SESIN|nr:uncharacterized protein LOC105170638 isoform X2 [Sesamum indicum]
MAFDCNERKTLLFSDLFKPHRNTIMSKLEGSSSSSSSNLSSSCDSSSSGFSTPLYSDLGSSEGDDDGDFIAELTRQMAECMLQEEEENADVNHVFEGSRPAKSKKERSDVDSGGVQYSSPVCVNNGRPPIQVYELKNQPEVVCKERRRAKGTESTQQKQLPKTEQQHYMQYRGREWGISHGHSGSGMQAVFLGGSGSRTGSPGTGVFLPRGARDPTHLKKKSGCSMVLMPTRVLQVLELHFNRVQDSSGAPPSSTGTDESTRKDVLPNGDSDLPANSDEMRLPQEWTY